MSTEDLLKNRHTTMLEWAEPWPGVTADGKDVCANVFPRATVDDCIAMTRYAVIKAHKVSLDDPRLQDDAKLLDEFMVVHWARVANESHMDMYKAGFDDAMAEARTMADMEQDILQVETEMNSLTWRPAATAPRDGTEFQGWFVSQEGIGFWEPSCKYNKKGELGLWGRVDYDTDGWDYDLGHLTLTHWMPQPEAPTEQEKQDDYDKEISI